MTNHFPVAAIIINREERQRKELKGIDELAASIAARGLINPITITTEGVLVAGERRLTAIKQLGWMKVPVTFLSELSPEELLLIELEENTHRLDITWQENVEATQRYHDLRKGMDAEWSITQTAEGLNLDRHVVVDRLLVRAALVAGVPTVVAADRFSVARNFCRRQESRRKSAIVEDILGEPVGAVAVGDDEETELDEASTPSPTFTLPEATPAAHPHLFHADFHQWVPAYTGAPFNLIHCDFPYGINFGKHNGQNSVNMERYEDSREIYKACLETLANAPVAESAHLIFWFSPVHFEFTKLALVRMGWIVNPFPFIWVKSDNSGLLPDPNRGGRRTYEMAFLASRGDRHIVRPVALHWHGARGDAVHASVKPRAMLEHLFRMYVDASTSLLDPTCGSGNAVRVAVEAGAARAVGLEQNETYWQDAVREWPM